MVKKKLETYTSSESYLKGFIKEIDDERGMALIISLLVLVVLTLTAMGGLFTATRGMQLAGNTKSSEMAYFVAEAGLERAVFKFIDQYRLNENFPTTGSPFDIDSDLKTDAGVSGGVCTNTELDDFVCAGGSLTDKALWADIANRTIAFYTAEDSDGASVPGKGHIGVEKVLWHHDTRNENTNLLGSNSRYEVYTYRYHKRSVFILSIGKVGNDGDDSQAIAAVEYELRISSDQILDNAIFAGGSGSDKSINGNVAIHGGVHVLGEGLAPNEIAVDLSGTARIHNNHEGMPAEFDTRMDALLLNASGEQSLEAKFRVKNGLVKIGSNAAGIGDDEQDNGAQDTMDGVYVNDGFTGDNDDQIFTEERKTYDEDVQRDITMPDLETSEIKNDNGDYEKLKDYLSASTGSTDKHLDPVALGGAANVCNITNDLSAGAWSYYGPGGDCSVVCITRDAAGLVHTTGIIDLSGCAGEISTTIGQNPDPQLPAIEFSDFEYTGKGTFYFGDLNVKFNGNILVEAGQSYPSNAALGFISKGDFEIGASPSSNVMGLFYAQNRIKVLKNTNIAGIIMTEQFDIGDQVPSIFQPPELSANAPSGFEIFKSGDIIIIPGGWRRVYY